MHDMTAGDLLRQALKEGASDQGIAKRLARSDDEANPEVKRWRYVVRRARLGSEPSAANIRRIAELFKVDPDTLAHRRPRPVPSSVEEELRGRLAEVEGDLAELEDYVKALAGEVQRLSRQDPGEDAGSRGRPASS